MENCVLANIPMDEGAKEYLVPYEGSTSKEDILLFQRIIGLINYVISYIGIDIAFVSLALMRYLTNPSPTYIKASKRILRYLAGIITLALVFEIGTTADGTNLYRYSDANYTSIDIKT